MILKRLLLVIMIKIFKYVDDTIGYLKLLPVKMPIVILTVRSEELMQTIFIKRPARLLDAFVGSASSIRGLRSAIERNLQIEQIQQLRQHVCERQTFP